MRKDRLLKLAAFLSRLPDSKFDFREYVKKWDAENHCGTVACAIGWCPKVFPKHWKWQPFTFESGAEPVLRNPPLKSEFQWCDDDAQSFFGISDEEFLRLFTPGRRRDGNLPGNAKAKDVAHHIREFVKASK